MPNNEPAENLDLLVYPFYTLSKIASRFRIDEESERNILSLKAKWMDSISDVSRDPMGYFVLVNGTDLPDKLLIQDEMTNPYRVCTGKWFVMQGSLWVQDYFIFF